MAVRPVFMAIDKPPYYREFWAEFLWNGGFAPSQKQKNIAAVHRSFLTQYPDLKVLEISSKSMQTGGVSLSAFHLKKLCLRSGAVFRWKTSFRPGKCLKPEGRFLICCLFRRGTQNVTDA